MKKAVILIISALLAASLLVGCTPASEIVTTTTEKPNGIILPEDIGPADTGFRDYVVCSKNFAFYSGEYNYFFSKALLESLETLEKEYGFDPDKSMKEQYVGESDMTWFAVYRDLTLARMKELLYVYELARDSGNEYTSAAEEYLREYVIPELEEVSDGDPSGYIYEQFDGAVLYENYQNALYIEYIYELYFNDKAIEKFDSLTSDEVKAYADSLDGEKDETPTRKAVYVRVPDGKNKAETLIESFRSGEEQTASALKKLANGLGYDYYEDSFVKGDESYGEIADWLFDAERAIGDSGAVEVKDDAYYAVLYLSDGEATYLYEARSALAYAEAKESIENGTGSYQGFKISAEKLDSIDV